LFWLENQIGAGRKKPVENMTMMPKHPGIDLIIVDAPEDLPVPLIEPHVVPVWNVRDDDFFDNVFIFADANLTDDGVILLMHPRDRAVERELDEHASEYNFEIVRDWWGYNPLRLTSALYHDKTVLF